MTTVHHYRTPSFVLQGFWAICPLIMIACAGTGDQSPTGAPKPHSAVQTFSVVSQVPKCDASRFGQVYYVTSEDEFYYCDGAGLNPLDAVGDPGADGTSWLVALSVATAEQCAGGGTVIHIGPDNAPRDGMLGAGEIAASQVVCNGADGEDGEDGANGSDGTDGTNGTNGMDGQNGADGQDGLTPFVVTEDAPEGACPNGGIAVVVGFDTNGNGVFDPDEVTDTSYVCNGVDGTGSEPPANLTTTRPEPVGDNCPTGGTRIDSGIDDDRDGELDANEIDNTTYQCICDETNWGDLFPNLAGCNLTGAELTDQDWPNVNLSNAELPNVDLFRSILSGANLSNANLTGAFLGIADLSNANLSGASLRFARATAATMTNANLSGADLTEADLTGVDLTGANLRNADLTDTVLVLANLSGADLDGALLHSFVTDETTICPSGGSGPCCGFAPCD